MTEELKEIGLNVGHRRIGRLMRQNGISVVRTRKHKVTTDSDHKVNIAPNLLDRDFVAERPNQKWAGDISYVWTREGWLYLAVILDAYSRRVIGWALARTLEDELTLAALRMALARRVVGPGLVHHSDRGSQYASNDYTGLLKARGIEISMSRKANPWDNAACESFMKTLKYEEVLRNEYRDLAEALTAIPAFLEKVYNERRLHSALGYVPPAEFEANLAARHNKHVAARRLVV